MEQEESESKLFVTVFGWTVEEEPSIYEAIWFYHPIITDIKALLNAL